VSTGELADCLLEHNGKSCYGCREGVVKKAAPTGVAEGGVNRNEALCAAFRALADVHDAKGHALLT